MATFTLLDAVTSTGNSDAFRSQENLARKISYQVSGSFVGTVALQGSLDGVSWLNAAAALTAPGIGTIDWFPFIRANVSAYTSGSITVKIA